MTVVIPNYNGAELLKNCLDSILEGSLRPRIIVVDNGSQDGSCTMLDENYPQVLTVKLPVNTGFCHAVNTGLHLVQTPYAMLLNNDTTVEKDALERLLEAIKRRPHSFAVQALMVSMQNPDIVDDAGDLYCALGWAFARGKGKHRDSAAKSTALFAACAGAAVYRMNVFDKIGWFDERHYCYLEDIDIGWRAQIYGFRSYLEPAAVVHHAGSATTGSRYNAFKEVMTAGNNALLLYKNMPLFQYWLNAPLWALGGRIKKVYFIRKGLGEAYQEGQERGRYLKALAHDYTVCRRYEIPYKKGSVSEEACVAGADEKLEGVLPLYLGERIPFSMRNLGHYCLIQGQLWMGILRRLV
jgi:GT2 family glycosyltransferase